MTGGVKMWSLHTNLLQIVRTSIQDSSIERKARKELEIKSLKMKRHYGATGIFILNMYPDSDLSN
jgi:hypothetical protein